MTIVIDGLSFSYEKTAILEKIDLQVSQGHFIGVFGPNGGGKTTLLKLLCALLRPNEGKISLLGMSPKLARKEIGYVPQTKRFDRQFPISVLEVVLQGALSTLSLWGTYAKETKEKARGSLERVGLLHKEQHAFGTLSGGEVQRVLIARALLGEPKILLLDEATAHVDLVTQRQILDLLVSLKGTMTIVLVTHDLQMIVNEADLLVCVNRRLTPYPREEVCRHFAIGLYHS